MAPTVVGRLGAEIELTVTVEAAHAPGLTAWIDLDDDPLLGGNGGQWQLTRLDDKQTSREIDGVEMRRQVFHVPVGVPLGWHTLHARSGDAVDAKARLVIVPDRLEVPESLLSRRGWGVMAQIYSHRSERSWGIGDFADLADLAAIAGREHGADFVLINPVHAGEAVPPLTPSPYLPSSRAFLNPIYIRPEAIEEFSYAPTGVREKVAKLAQEAARDNENPEIIDRDRVWRLKRQALEAIHALPLSAARQADFAAFRKERGEGLRTFCLFAALEEAGNPPTPQTMTAHGPEAECAASEHTSGMDFHAWLQWIADGQLGSAQRRAKDSGMRVGIMSDLAVGVHSQGADAWALADVLAHGVCVGAPPDPFNQQGQNWSQPPWRPDTLSESGYEPFKTMIRAVLRNAGAIRIDHILGLFRLWWIPEGASPTKGCYVEYDHEAMVGIVALEAHRVGALVVGEDLGVSEPWVHEYLPSRGILGSNVLWFEWEGKEPKSPEWYRRMALTTVTVHDLPPSAAYLEGEQVDLRARLGLLRRPEAEERQAARIERDKVLSMLRDRGLIARGAVEPPTVQLVLALHRFIRSTPSVLLGISLADAVGERRAQNMPGTDNEYPNWRIPLADSSGRAVLLDDLPRVPMFAAITAAVSGR